MILQWLKKHFVFVALGLILLFGAGTRLWRLEYPNQYYFDEVYHVVTAKLMAQNDPRAYEWWNPAPEPNTAVDWLHPPLAKLIQASAMNLFGFTSWSWRISSSLFGVGVILLVFLLSKRFGFSDRTALLAALLASLDGLLLTMSRITMNDIHVTFFYLLTLWLYLGWKQNPQLKTAAFVALAAGAAVASKWSGIFVVGVLGFDQLFEFIRSLLWQKKWSWQRFASFLALICILVPTVYVLSYGQMWWQGKDLQHFQDLHEQIWWYQTNLEATHPYQSTPQQWLFALRPVYAYTKGVGENQIENIYLQANPVLLWGGLVAVFWTIGMLSGFLIRLLEVTGELLQVPAKRFASTRSRLWRSLQATLDHRSALVLLVAAYFSTWIAWVTSPRIMFFYHYTPAIPFLCILLAYWLNKLPKKWSWVGVSYIAVVATLFIVFYPNWTGISVPREPFYDWFFAIESWR